MSVSPVAAGLFDRQHNPMWTIIPTPFAAKDLLEFWRKLGEDGEIVHDFTDETWNTRFLGDLYQDLSEHARDTYALLQTPEFVEEFILKYTLEPAIEEFGLEPDPPYGHDDLPHHLRVIDPACGSGHFLLGAFRRLLTAWRSQPRDRDEWDLVSNALESIHGVDKNPFAVTIARFRLMLAAMQAADVKRLSAKVDFPLNIAVGDSLLHGKGASGIQGEFEFDSERPTHTYRTEDIDDYIKSVDILGIGTYHAVVANPPYITVKDKQENNNYRKAYKSCSGKYHLSVPFTERIFQLAIRGAEDGASSGYTGQITDNAFMDREFGKKLIQEYFPNVDLTHVIDMSGVPVPSHGTPTVILIGRRRYARSGSTIRAVLGVRGEPVQPLDPAKGKVWQAIVDQIEHPRSESVWVSVVDLPRDRLAKHPWSLTGGGADKLMAAINGAPDVLDRHLSRPVGFASFPGQDDAFFLGTAWLRRNGVKSPLARVLIAGDTVRDWGFIDHDEVLVPFDEQQKPIAFEIGARWGRHLWSFRRILSSTTGFAGQTREDSGEPWWTWYRWVAERYATPLSITFAEVATHNHFVLDRGGKVFKQTAPVVKLPEAANEDDHLALLAILNSSTICFWLQQVCHNKGGPGGGSSKDEKWHDFYQLNGTNVREIPLSRALPLHFGRGIDSLAQMLAAAEPSAVCAEGKPTRERLEAARVEHERIRARMIALQEELDWEVYRRYGLLVDAEVQQLVAKLDSVPELNLGERAFEIVLARRIERGEVVTQWFARHRSTPVTEIPAHWPQEYRDVVAKRIETIERSRNIGLIERPECKRRWQSELWETREREALRKWLLDRCEERSLWYGTDGQPRAMTVNRLADRLRADADVVSVARLLKGPDADLADVLREITAVEHVPYLAQLRYKGEGLLKRTLWERTWDLQRAEDRSGNRLDIPVPPKYTSADFLKNSYWRQRGKLDVPKERFTSYPWASPDSDDSLLLGWAGWDHREQAHVLITLIEERSATDGWDIDRLKPLLAGLAEVMPWVRQWHAEIDDGFGASPAEAYDTYLIAQREKYGLTEEDLNNWKPPQPTGSRRARS